MNIKPQLFLTFAKIGAFTFGGGYAMISLIENECVTKRKWLTHDEFMDMTVIAEATPGPIAINCATYIGHKKEGVLGAALATFGVVLPSFLIILLISTFFENLLQYEIVGRAFKGIHAAVAIMIIRAGVNMIQKMTKSNEKPKVKIAFISVFFLIIFVMNLLHISISTIYLMMIAGLLGFFMFRGEDDKK